MMVAERMQNALQDQTLDRRLKSSPPKTNGHSEESPTTNPIPNESPAKFLQSKRLLTTCTADPNHPIRANETSKWRSRERFKTVSVALFLCLNIGVDPPDVVKPSPCAKLECWIDPFSLPPVRALDTIGRTLQEQYEVWQARARYKLALDPTIEETKKLCCSLRKSAKEERILFHYNGHGVPKPTPSGEIWVFNTKYSQYIPVSVHELQTWLGSPCIYVYDCNAAGNILHSFNRFAAQRDAESGGKPTSSSHRSSGSAATSLITPPAEKGKSASSSAAPGMPVTKTPFRESIQLAACAPNETLSTNPDLPQDLFSSCLTTPIRMAVRFFLLQNADFGNRIDLEQAKKIPGRPNDRRTPLGELNWIFTAITDTIAWNMFPRDVFKRLFRQDVIVAALFRNFLLAGRIMRAYGCTPISSPTLPATHRHPMWDSWDFALDMVLSQLPTLLVAQEESDAEVALKYKHSTFFAEQLTAFEMWLKQAKITKQTPEQLPIVLQVLLSQVHRFRALFLLTQFLDLGEWAVQQALDVGIFPYVLKLLQSPAMELKPVLVFIWARILAYDQQCQNDLIKDNGFSYFVNILDPEASLPSISNLADHRVMCAFVLSTFCHKFRSGQQCCLQQNLLPFCSSHLTDSNAHLRQWACICMAKVIEGFDEATSMALKLNIHNSVSPLLADAVPEVRAAALVFFAALMRPVGEVPEYGIHLEFVIARQLLQCLRDTSAAVRKELVNALSAFLARHIDAFVDTASEFRDMADQLNAKTLDERRIRNTMQRMSLARMSRAETMDTQNLYLTLWKVLLILSVDPHSQVARRAGLIVDVILVRVLNEGKQGARHPDGKSLQSSSHTNIKALDNRIPHTNWQSRLSTLWTDAVELVPLQSGLMEWAREYFAEPQTRPSEEEEAGSVAMLQREWRFTRKAETYRKAQAGHPDAAESRWDTTLSSFTAQTSAFTQMLFHPFEEHLVGVDNQSMIRTWNWKNGARLHRFKCGIPPHCAVTSLSFINEDDVSLLLVAANDGAVRIYRNYAGEFTAMNSGGGPSSLVTSWRPMTDMFGSARISPLITRWLKSVGHLLVGGDSRVIRIFDMETELPIGDMHTKSNQPVTCLTNDGVRGDMQYAGFADGGLRLFDRRLDGRDAQVNSFRGHGARMVNLHLQTGSDHSLLSASISGEIMLWDLRNSAVVGQTRFILDQEISSFAAHNHMPIFACGSNAVKIHNFQKNQTLTVQWQATSLGTWSGTRQRGPSQAVAFHPLQSVLGLSWESETRVVKPTTDSVAIGL